jgi:hypothetical protein
VRKIAQNKKQHLNNWQCSSNTEVCCFDISINCLLKEAVCCFDVSIECLLKESVCCFDCFC